MAQVLERLLCKQEALNSIPSTNRERKRERVKERMKEGRKEGNL
jgi:hypothetical protein